MFLLHQLIGRCIFFATAKVFRVFIDFSRFTFSYVRRPLQRPNQNRKGDNRKNSQAKTSGSGKPAKKGGNASSSQPNTARNKRSMMNGNAESSQSKDDEQKEEEPADEEKKFEASNHMEGDLVDILGIFRVQTFHR